MNKSVAGILFKNESVLVALRKDSGKMGSRWEFPGGKVEDAESDEEALKREFLEEFNTNIIVGDCIAQTSFIHNGIKRILNAYIIFNSTDIHTWELLEHTELQWVALESINSMPFVNSDLQLLPEIQSWIKNC